METPRLRRGENAGDLPISPVTQSERMFCGPKYKRLSSGKFCWWPTCKNAVSKTLAAHQMQVLLSAGNPEAVQAAPTWRSVGPAA
jgi:hypothetical protein